jgi:glycosyltransferase involved in cell wall biosynthesis
MITRGVYPIATGGVEIHVDSVARILKDKVDFTLLHEGRFIKKPPYRAISVTRKFVYPGILPQIRAFISSIGMILGQKYKPDVIHIQTATLPLMTGFVTSLLLRVPFIVSCHGGGIRKTINNRIQRLLKSFIIRKAKAVTCVSKELRKIIHETLRVQSNLIRIIPNGFDHSLLEIPPREGPIRAFVSISNFRKEKDPITLLAAIREVKKVFSEIQLQWIGDGYLLQESKKYVVENNLGENVKFLGRQSHSSSIEILSSGDAFILSSIVEGLPTAMIEAMALAKPVIVTNVGGLSDIVENDRTGFLVEPGNPTTLSKAIISLMQNGSTAETFGFKAREEVRHLDWHSIATKYSGLYQSVLTYKTQFIITSYQSLSLGCSDCSIKD